MSNVAEPTGLPFCSRLTRAPMSIHILVRVIVIVFRWQLAAAAVETKAVFTGLVWVTVMLYFAGAACAPVALIPAPVTRSAVRAVPRATFRGALVRMSMSPR
nr:hypothetical protein StreXyl84_79960 [Streptomyces sp. Xyl84]